MTKSLLEQLEQLITAVVAGMGYEFVGCELQPRGRRRLVRVYIDSPDGIKIDDCERVSRQLSSVLDVEDPIPGGYDLEVSSPGENRPLFTLKHYQQFQGKKIRIRLHIPLEGRRNFSGVLDSVEMQIIRIIGENGEVWNLPFSDIEKGNLIEEY